MKHLILFLAAVAFLGAAAALPAADVGLIKVEGTIGPATANYISRAINASAARGDSCLIIQLDTPGGLLNSTKDIVQDFYASKVPTVVYVAPSGAYAASAGTFITMAADVAAMAPNTSIGAAHPIEIGAEGSEKLDDVMKEKLENFASSEIEAIAERRGRNAEWATNAVRQSASITAEKALELHVIDLIATNLDDLLVKLDGRKVGSVRLETAHASIVEIKMGASEKLFQLLWTPEVMLLLTMAALYGLIGELSNPGAVLPGVVGAIALVLFLYMSAVIPVNLSGLIFLGLAAALFVIDVYAPTHGVLTLGGIVSFFLGLLLLFSHAEPGFQLPLPSIILSTALTAAFFLFFVGAGIRAQRLPVKVGREVLIGKVVPAGEGGRVFVEGEWWNAQSDRPIQPGQPVEIVAVEGLTLRVRSKAV